MAQDLLNGCSYSDLWVTPKNWKTLTSKKALESTWYVACKFYDPIFRKKYPKGFPYRIRLNRFKTLDDRKKAAATLLEEIPVLLEIRGFNPITKTFMAKPELSDMVTPETKVIDAFRKIHAKYIASPGMVNDVKLTINNIEKSILELDKHNKRFAGLRLSELSIFDFKIGKIKFVLDNLQLTNGQYNKFLTNLSILFSELVESEAVEHNPIKDMKRKKTVKTIRETLSIEEFIEISEMLKVDHPTFYRYAMIFFESGSRTSELFRLQAKDVNLLKQEYKVVIQKGKQFKEVVKVIMPDVLNFWVDIMKEVSSPDEYLFSKDLRPGLKAIQPYQITKRWKRLIKDRWAFSNGKLVGKSNKDATPITADFYALKHLFLTLLARSSGNSKMSSTIAGHTTTITEKVYLVDHQDHKNEVLKKTKIGLFPVSA